MESRPDAPCEVKHDNHEHGERWYCESEQFTIQFLRSGFQHGEPFLFEGRIAVCTTDNGKTYIHKHSASLGKKRYMNLRKWIRKAYTNNAIIYQNAGLPRSATNPIQPAADIWVGPHAQNWLADDPKKGWGHQSRFGKARGYLMELIGKAG